MPEAPFKFLETIEKLYARYPQFNKFEEFEKTIVDFDLTLADFNITVASDECNDYIEAEVGILGLYSVKYKFYRRKLKCRIPSQPSPLPTNDFEKKYFIPPACSQGRQVYIWHEEEKYEYIDYLSTVVDDPVLKWEFSKNTSKINKVVFPDKVFDIFDGQSYLRYVEIHTTQTFEYKSNFLTETPKKQRDYTYIYYYGFLGNRFNLGNFGFEEFGYTSGWISFDHNFFVSEADDDRQKTFQRTRKRPAGQNPSAGLHNPGNPGIYINSAPDNYKPADDETESPERTVSRSFVSSEPGTFAGQVITWRLSTDDAIVKNRQVYKPLVFCENYDQPLPPPPPPPRSMKCCPDYSDLLKQIYKIVKQNKDAIGVDDLPANLPASFIKTGETESGQIPQPNLVQILGWYFQRFDEIMGQFELQIDVEDIDAVTSGNQKLELRLPNIAETLSEMIMMLTTIMYNSDLGVNLTTRAMIEAGQIKQTTYKNHELIDTIVDF
ncbi:MAG: hypothetical protein HC836_11270 [Richelia sp. RM2_1_2]|nr:hypothetical protein [Richelia sp. RM2_1_2]